MPNNLSIFIDGGHYNIVQRYYNASFDFKQFIAQIPVIISQRLTTPVQLVHIFYYDSLPYADSYSTPEEREGLLKHRNYFNFLKAQNVIVREGITVKHNNTPQQKQVDMLLGLDMLQEANKGLITHAALIAGDGDLVPAVEALASRHIQVWLFHAPLGTDMCSTALWSIADGRVPIDEEFARLSNRSTGENKGAM